MTEDIIQLSLLESAVNDAFGEAVRPPLPKVSSLEPLEALEEAVLPALKRPPCLVMFSGGRDSSIVLAIANRVARREGLPLPLPTTQFFPGFPETDETEWQRLVLEHLRLPDQLCHVYPGDRNEMNLLGPFVQESIRQHGLIAPAGSHLLIPTLREAAGGSVLTGQGGDRVFYGGNFAGIRAEARGHERPTMRAPLTTVKGLAPGPVRRAVARRRFNDFPSWLRPEAHEQFTNLVTAERASEPLRWDTWIRWLARLRQTVMYHQATAVLAETYDVLMCHPLMDDTFLASLASKGGSLGWGRRTATLKALFAPLLPEALVTRQSKAWFTRPYWSGDAREFIERWDGGGVPTDIVDADALRTIWSSERPDTRTGLLLHAAWASTLAADEIKQPFNCRLN